MRSEARPNSLTPPDGAAALVDAGADPTPRVEVTSPWERQPNRRRGNAIHGLTSPFGSRQLQDAPRRVRSRPDLKGLRAYRSVSRSTRSRSSLIPDLRESERDDLSAWRRHRAVTGERSGVPSFGLVGGSPGISKKARGLEVISAAGIESEAVDGRCV